MNSEACLGGEIAAVLLTCVGSGMLNTVPPSLSCKNFQSPFALPGYLFSRNLLSRKSTSWRTQWLTLSRDSEEILGRKVGKELRRTQVDTHTHTHTHWLIALISFSGIHGKLWLQQHQSFHGDPSEPTAVGRTVPSACRWEETNTDNLKVHPALLLPSANPLPTVLPMAPRGSSHPWTLPAHWGSSSQCRAGSSPAQSNLPCKFLGEGPPCHWPLASTWWLVHVWFHTAWQETQRTRVGMSPGGLCSDHMATWILSNSDFP